MKATLIIIAFALISLYLSTVNGQSSIVCTDRKEDSYTDSIFTIYAVLCGDDDSIYLEISYPSYTGEWFGIVFGTRMNGQAAVYTTGQSDDRTLTLSSYTLTRPQTSVTYNMWDWDEVSTDTSNGIKIIYKTLLSNTDYTLSTASIPMRHAYGSSTSQLAYHGSGKYSAAFTMDFVTTSSPTTAVPTTAAPTTLAPTTTAPTTATPTVNPTTAAPTTANPTLPQGVTAMPTSAAPTTSDPTTAAPTTAAPTTAAPTTAAPTTVIICSNGNEATVSDDTMTIQVILCEDDDMAYLDITYPEYSDVWFGVVFSTNMLGDAAIYTTGKADDRALAMYAYELTSKNFDLSGIVYDSSIVWTQVLVDTTNGIRVIYKTALSNYGFTTSTESVSIRYAYGSSTQLAYHASRSNAAQILDFSASEATSEPTTGAPTTTMPTLADGVTYQPSISPTSEAIGEFEECVAATEVKDGLSVSIGRRRADKYMQITMMGPNTQYFAYGFGGSIMDGTYAISVEGAVGDGQVFERTLGPQRAGQVIANGSIIDLSIEDDGEMRTVVITRKYAWKGTYDFTDLLSCEVEAIDAIAAEGDGVGFGYHSFGKSVGTLTRSCDCDPTAAPTSDDMVDDSSANNIFNVFYIGLVLGLSLYLMT